MKTKSVTVYHSIGGAAAVAVLLIASSVSAQNLFVSDYSTDDIYEITPGGAQSVFASGLNFPYGLAFNSAGNLFVSNTANNSGESGNIMEITPNGNQSVFASGIDPLGIAFNSAGNLFAADYNSGNIYEYTPKGVQSTFATGFSLPLSMAFDSAGNLFVAAGWGIGNGYITKITPNGTQSLFASGLSFPNALAFNSAGDLFEADNGTGTVFEFNTKGTQSTFASVNNANSLAFNSAGDLFVADSSGPIVEIAPNGTESPFTSVSGIPAEMTFQPVPEPSVWAFIGTGAVVFLACYRTRTAKTLNA